MPHTKEAFDLLSNVVVEDIKMTLVDGMKVYTVNTIHQNGCDEIIAVYYSS